MMIADAPEGVTTSADDKLAAAMAAIDDVANDESASEAKKQESLLAIKVQIEELLYCISGEFAEDEVVDVSDMLNLFAS